MNTRALALIAIISVSLAPSVVAQQADMTDPVAVEADIQQASDENAAEERDDEAIECRNLAPRVGTRIPGRRVCLTLFQWKQWEENTKEEMRDTERMGLIRNRG
ncbi:hypothetical protein K3181_14405 [Qipengyuania sp. YG27]|uniref:UrcA family protein n=1 Tax=Qipengyuania mesophila TaxID=2867246 RepID=A0ABS7JY95_9SPHN|nr:hypothetical protein [Qipengyuania mesophila]MBX7502630.1 hypothetical protein [Qipengyuania mesophila]